MFIVLTVTTWYHVQPSRGTKGKDIQWTIGLTRLHLQKMMMVSINVVVTFLAFTQLMRVGSHLKCAMLFHFQYSCP